MFSRSSKATKYIVRSPSPEKLRQLLESDPSLVTYRDRYGKSLLHIAAERGNDEIVKVLIDAKFDLECLDKSSHTPLYAAVDRNLANVVAMLIQNGANPLITEPNGETLYHAVAKGRTDTISVLQVLIGTEIDRNAKELEHGRTALMLALECEHYSIATFLVENGVDLTIQDNYGSTCQNYTKDKEMLQRISNQIVNNELSKRGIQRKATKKAFKSKSKRFDEAAVSQALADTAVSGFDDNGFRLEIEASPEKKADHSFGSSGIYNQKKAVLKKLQSAKCVETGGGLFFQSTTQDTNARGIFNPKTIKLRKQNAEDYASVIESTPENDCTSWAGLTTFCLFGSK